MLTFPPGSSNEDMECLNIMIIDDNTLENTESLLVELTTTVIYVIVNADARETTIIIRDNDGEKIMMNSQCLVTC